MAMSNDQQIPHNQGHISCKQVSAKEFAAKFKSKRECYTFLANECEVYLPPYGKFRQFINLIMLNNQTM